MPDDLSAQLDDLQDYVGKSETSVDVVTASAVGKIASTLSIENPATKIGDPVPPGWHRAFFPGGSPTNSLRIDGQPSGRGLTPQVPLPRRSMFAIRAKFEEPFRIGDELTRTMEVAGMDYTGEGESTILTMKTQTTLSTKRGVSCVEVRETIYRGVTPPDSALPDLPAETAWRESIELTPMLLYRFAALEFNTHRVHYDREWAMETENFPGLVAPGTMFGVMCLEMCRRESPGTPVASMDFERTSARFRICDNHSPITIAGQPGDGGAEFWVAANDRQVGFTASAKF